MAGSNDAAVTVYVSGALKGSQDIDKARALYEKAAQIIRSAGHQAYLPHQHTDPEYAAEITAVQVFRRDVAALRAAKGVVVFLSEPSLGVGAELAICAQAGTPMLGLYKPQDNVSRFAFGLLEAAGAQFGCYGDIVDMNAAIRDFLKTISKLDP